MKLGDKKSKYTSYTSEKKKKAGLKVAAIAVGSALVVGGVYQFVVMDYYGNKVREETTAELTGSNGEYVQAYILNKDIVKGAAITKEDISQITQNSKLVPTAYVTDPSKLEGMVTRINLSANSVVTNDMIVKLDEEITDSIKDQDYDWIDVHAFLKLDNYVDIHYKELDGTDTIVASKKKIKNLNGNIFSMDITEEERAYINNATVKAAVTKGTLYTTIYPDPENQGAAKVTYKLDKAIEEKIKDDPNIVKDAADEIKKDGNSDSNNEDKNSKSSASNSTITEGKPQFLGGEN